VLNTCRRIIAAIVFVTCLVQPSLVLAAHGSSSKVNVVIGNDHATVIYGASIIYQIMSIMDPEYGFTSAGYSSGYYSYVSSSSGITYRLNSHAR